MRNTSRCSGESLPISLVSLDPPRSISQGYTAIRSVENQGYHADEAVSRNSIPLHDITSEGTPADVTDHDDKNITGFDTMASLISLDKRPPHRSRFRGFQETITKFWLWEVAACLFSLASLASIVGVLIYEDGKQLDQWAWSIPPTAVVSFIGTLTKASIVLVLSQVLSQLKWLHFQKTRSLQHVRIFDWGSRGPLGSLLVIWSSRKALASIAACLMILTILVDPFIQLVFSFPSRLVPDSQQAQFLRIDNWDGEQGPIAGIPIPRTWTSINQGLSQTNITPNVVCPSGNCIWSQPIKTLGVCGSCSNVTANVQKDCSDQGDCTYTFNNASSIQANLRINQQEGGMNWPSRTLWNSTPTHTWQSLPGLNSIANFTLNNTVVELNGNPFTTWASNGSIGVVDASIIGFNAIQLPPLENITFIPSAILDLGPATCWSCELYWCEKSFENLQVSNGGTPTFTVSTKPLWFLGPVGQNYGHAPSVIFFGLYPSEVGMLKSSVWNFRYRVVNVMTEYLGGLFQSYYEDSTFFLDSSDYVPDNMGSTQTNLAYNPGALFGLGFSEDLNATISIFADSLSESIRTGSGAIEVQGQSLVSKTFIHVRWPWLALPLALMTITCVLLPLVAMQSHSSRIAVWKDDPLALLFHHVEGVESVPGSDSETGPEDLNNLADQMYVRLDRDTSFTFVRTIKTAK